MKTGISTSGRPGTVKWLRTAVLGLFVMGTVGAGVELLLMEHTESPWQLVPLLLMAASLLSVIWFLVVWNGLGLRGFQILMGLFVVSGFVGLYLHYRGNVEFELEMYPSLKGLALFWEAIRGATPVLDPGTMIELGLLGLAYTYRHPVLLDAREPHETTMEQTG